MSGQPGELAAAGEQQQQRAVSFEFDGTSVAFRDGMSVAAALWASGRRTWRITERGQMARGYYCGDGFCYDCLVVVNGEPNVRACQTSAQPGMRVATQVGFGAP